LLIIIIIGDANADGGEEKWHTTSIRGGEELYKVKCIKIC